MFCTYPNSGETQNIVENINPAEFYANLQS